MADEYIKRDDALVALEKSMNLNQMRERLKRLTAADVVERKRGKWVKAKGSWCAPGGDPVWECSECGKGVHVYGIEHGTYGKDVAEGQWVACPNCGAKMDGEV